MTVQELINLLEKIKDKDTTKVVVEVLNNDGCDTCGYGASSSDREVSGIEDLESRIVITLRDW